MFTELKCKTSFSFLQGASSAAQYIRQAHALGMRALAITDNNGVYSLPRAFEAIKEIDPGFKLIAGSEITVTAHPKITLLATSRKAYGLMCRLITKLHAGKEKGEGKISLFEMIELFENHNGADELICLPELSPQCNFAMLKEIFPKIYLPLCRYLDGLDSERTELAKKLSEEFSIPIVATNDVHYHESTRRPLQDAMTCIRHLTNIDDAGFLLFGNDERYLKSNLQMRALFADLPEAVKNSEVIEQQCHFCLSELKYSYPHEFIPPGHTAKSYLEEVVYQGANLTYRGLIPPKANAQIRRELDFFAKRGHEHYFLTVYDIVRFANEKNILCQGRGSAANSIVCYVLGITSVDPIHMNLLFDRFMNEGRNEPPDIDIDFEHDRREEVIQYIYSRFGRERAAMVAAVRTYRSRSAFLELSKAVGIKTGTISAGELELRFDEIAAEKKERRLFVEQLSEQMKGFPRHLSIHSGGFVLSNDPLIEMVPVEPARMENRTIIQWDKDDLETLGLMKVDVLSIGFLTALHMATDSAQISWRDIPPDDKKTYEMIQRAETHGTFQIESRAQMNMLPQTRPQNYYDLVVQVALVRPSPTVGGMVQPYLRGLHESRRGKHFTIHNEKLDRILRRTHGVPIFQEQVMQVSIDVAGFSPAEADQLRRSLGKSRTAESVDSMGKKLYASLIENNIPKEFADHLFNFIKGYAHYGFPESHAASYASLAYKSAYLKCHYPAELVCALINSQPMGFYPIDTLIHEFKRSFVQFLPLHPNLSHWEAKIESPKCIRMGFQQLRGAREADVMALLTERETTAFSSPQDFIFRTHFSKEVLENMAMADFFSCFGVDRRHSFWQSIELSHLNKKNEKAQLSLFNENLTHTPTLDLFQNMSLLEKIQTDHRKLGYSLHGNLMKAIRIELPDLPKTTSQQVKKMPKDREVTYAGILTVFQRPPPAKGTAFITLEDEFGSVDSVIKKEIFEKFEDILRSSRFLIFSGKIQKRGEGSTLIVSHIDTFSRQKDAKPIGPMQDLGTLRW